MRSLGWVTVVCLGLACNGKDSSSDTGGDDDDDTTEPIVCDIPQFELDPLTCGQLASALLDTVHAGDSCNRPEDCWVFRASCETWNEVGCHYAANTQCLSQSELGEFNTLSAQKNCATTQVCDCGGTPEVDCVDHICQLVDSTGR
jgi:hypothetical protein